MAKIQIFLGLLAVTQITQISGSCDQSRLNDLTFTLSGGSMKWPCQSTRNIYIQTQRYVPKNVIMTRTQIYRDSAFVAMPRFKQGVPITLGKVSLRKGLCVSEVEPYPCWSLQEEGNCQALQSVVDLYLDAQDILWVLDVGIVNTLEQPIRRCPPKVVGISVASGKVVKVLDLSNLVVADSKLQHLVVDYDEAGRCFVYIADAGSRAILVWDITNNKSYRVVLPAAVASSSPASDVLYIVLVQKSGSKYLYFTYLNSPRLFSIKTEHLRNGQGSGAVVDVGQKPSGLNTVLLGTDNKSGVFFRFKGQSDIMLWDAESCFKPANFLEVQRGGDCRLATQVVPGYRRHMWAIESNFQDYISDTVGCAGASIVLHPVVKDCNDP